MTKPVAKMFALKVWREIRDKNLARKSDLSPALLRHLERMRNRCPFCAMRLGCMSECPLKLCMSPGRGTGLYRSWLEAPTASKRYRAAARIVNAIEAWEV